MENEHGVRNALQALSQALGNPALNVDESTGDSFEAALIREATRRILQMPLVPWQHTRTIATLPNVVLTPTVVLARTLEKAQHGKIKSVWIGLQWAQNDTFGYDYSRMAVSDLGMHRLVLERRLQRVAFGDDHDSETINPAS